MDRTDGYGGIAVYIKQGLSYKIISKMNQHNNIQILGVEIALIKYYLIYIPPRAQLPIDFFHQHLNLNNGPLVLLGDFNCRYPEIYQNQADRNGIILREAARQYELELLNSDTPTRIPQPTVRSYAVDLIFTSIDIATTTQWLCTEETLGSDHYITTCNIERQNMAPRFIYRRMGQKNVDYKKFQRKLEEKEELNQPNIDGSNKYSEVTNTIQQYLNEHHPYKIIDTQRMSQKTKPIWWTIECNKIIAERKRAYHRYMQNI
jgi:hypothetical protein